MRDVVLKYLRALGSWAFGRWRIHQAVVGALVVAAGLLVTRFQAQPKTMGACLLAWLAVLMFIVAPARLWREQEQRLRPGVAFVDHEDDRAIDHNAGILYRRVTVKNQSAVLLTGVEVLVAAIEPRPDEVMTLHVPLQPMHASPEATRFPLQPGMHRSVNVLSMDLNAPYADLWHVVDAVPRNIPLGRYRMKLVVSTDQTSPTEQWFTMTVDRQTNRPYRSHSYWSAKHDRHAAE